MVELEKRESVDHNAKQKQNSSPPQRVPGQLAARCAPRQPRAMASAAAAAVSVPLNLSGMIRTFIAMRAPTFRTPPAKVKFDLWPGCGSVVAVINYE